jgi:cell division protein FtsI/penicillin-binding protein 2
VAALGTVVVFGGAMVLRAPFSPDGAHGRPGARPPRDRRSSLNACAAPAVFWAQAIWVDGVAIAPAGWTVINRDNAPLSASDDRRLFALSTLATGVFVLLALRLFFLQVVRGPEFSRRAERNSTQLLPFLAPRGTHLRHQPTAKTTRCWTTRRGFPCSTPGAGTRPSRRRRCLAELSRWLPEDRPALQRKMAEARRTGKMTRLLANIPRESALAIMERRAFLPGVNVLAEPQRRTRYGSLASQLLGYVSEVDENDLKSDRDRWRSGQFIGRGGVEKVYDDLLRGTDGGLQFVTDAAGRHIQVLGRLSSVPGADLHLTIDRRLQQAAEAGLDASPVGSGRGGGARPAHRRGAGHGQPAGVRPVAKPGPPRRRPAATVLQPRACKASTRRARCSRSCPL